MNFLQTHCSTETLQTVMNSTQSKSANKAQKPKQIRQREEKCE